MTEATATSFRPIQWMGDRIRLIDQTLLPSEEVWLQLRDHRDVVAAIRQMRVRGAPAIGVAGAYALVLAAKRIAADTPQDWRTSLRIAAAEIEAARPTGANLAWAVRRMMTVADAAADAGDAARLLAEEAVRIQDEDEDANRRIGRHGAELLAPGCAVLTHCNTGALATGGFGTALGVIQTAWEAGRLSRVFATETRPLLQGARLTAWELTRAGVEVTLLADSAAGQLMRRGEVQYVVVGADRIAANGDVVNKIGTYSLAVLARENGVAFYVAAPTSTVDLNLPTGDDVPIEEREAQEVTHLAGSRVAAEGASVVNAAFDVTPARYVSAIITESGVVRPPYEDGLGRAMVSGLG